ncbi:hypothetical protein SDC9_180526 [bioreactor metagenome]|uniref:Uncharacterized protein n=1 Tax=bioreactor metagenome TaxID=1076179 RepID=A0A645HB73_9ZZZZ
MFVNSYYFTETLAFGAGSNGRVKRKHLVVRFLKLDAVDFKFGTERMQTCRAVGQVEAQHAQTVTLVHGSLRRVG